MRVLAVTNVYPTSDAPGVGTFIEQQIKGLRQVGLDVDVMLVDRTRGGMRSYLGVGRQLSARIKKFQPDIVHTMYGGVMAGEVMRSVKDTATVVSFCGSDLLGEHLSGYLEIGRPMAGCIRKLLSGYGVWASHKAARRATGIVVKSRNLRDALPNDVARSKVRIIPNGIDFERFKPLDRDACRARLGWSSNRFHALFPMNSGDPCKRPQLASAAVAAVNRLGIQAEIHQLRGVPHDEVPIWLNASDVVMLTSLHEGSPNIIKEALTCDIPVVSVDVGDVRERVEGMDGCYLALPQPTDLAAKLRLVFAGPRRVAGRTKMRELSLERVAYRLKSFYEEVVGLRGYSTKAKVKRPENTVKVSAKVFMGQQ